MSFPGELRHTPAATSDGGSDPLQNLSAVHNRIDSLQKFLHNSVNNNTLIEKDQMEIVSAELTSAIHQIIVNGAALLASSQTHTQTQTETQTETEINIETSNPKSRNRDQNSKINEKFEDPKMEDYDIIELDAMELLAEHFHFCEICGKGFKRDANLRMHMRAHGDQFKTPEALAKPDGDKCVDFKGKRKTRFSCPFIGCNRNKLHKKFRPLKSIMCVKNHFKRSHCPKMYSCTRCNKKTFSVVADLKSHLKHCGESKWKCSCGTNFSRKDKLFGHMALFGGHMPAVMEAEEGGKVVAEMVEDEDEEDMEIGGNGGVPDNDGMFEGLVMDGFGSIDNYCFQDVLDSSNANGVATGMDGFFKFYDLHSGS